MTTKAPVFEAPVVEARYWGKVFGHCDEATASNTDELRVTALRAGRHGIGVVKSNEFVTPQALIRPSARLLTRCRHFVHLLPAALWSAVQVVWTIAASIGSSD